MPLLTKTILKFFSNFYDQNLESLCLPNITLSHLLDPLNFIVRSGMRPKGFQKAGGFNKVAEHCYYKQQAVSVVL